MIRRQIDIPVLYLFRPDAVFEHNIHEAWQVSIWLPTEFGTIQQQLGLQCPCLSTVPCPTGIIHVCPVMSGLFGISEGGAFLLQSVCITAIMFRKHLLQETLSWARLLFAVTSSLRLYQQSHPLFLFTVKRGSKSTPIIVLCLLFCTPFDMLPTNRIWYFTVFF